MLWPKKNSYEEFVSRTKLKWSVPFDVPTEISKILG